MQVGLAGGEPAGGCLGLIEAGMHPTCFGVYQVGQGINIGRLELG